MLSTNTALSHPGEYTQNTQTDRLTDYNTPCRRGAPRVNTTTNNYLYTAHYNCTQSITLTDFYIGGLESNPPLGFIPSIGCVVVGHYSLSGNLEEDHFNFVEEWRANFFPCTEESTSLLPMSVLTGIIKKLSFEGRTIIDATSDSGKIAALVM